MSEDLRVEVVHDVSENELPLRGLLEQLDRRHHLRDSSFLRSAHHVSAPMLAVVAVRRGKLVGWLAGNPSTGHIALVGVLETRQGVGSALVGDFAVRARRAGAAELTVTVDTEPAGRWDRRRFFISHGFSPVSRSALHFARPVDNTPFR
ncbi:GNAT family N-acetyltransferase [Nocardia gipuzkoensis]